MAKKNKQHQLCNPAALISNKRRRIVPTDDAVPAVSATPSLPPTSSVQRPISATDSAHHVTVAAPTVHVVAGSKIQAKVRSAISLLTEDTSVSSHAEPAACEHTVGCAGSLEGADEDATRMVLLQGRASAANKLITIAEVIKRILDHQRKPWWAYTGVDGALEQEVVPDLAGSSKRKLREDRRAHGDEQSDDAAESDHENEVFELLDRGSTSSTGMIKKKPVLLVYLATNPVPALKTLFGEQSSRP